MRFRSLALALVLAIGGVGHAMAATAFSNDFSAGIGPSEYVYGAFSTGNGSVGTQGPYDNNALGAYGFTANLQGYTQATLTYNYDVGTEPCCDYFRVYAAANPLMLMDSTLIASYSGNQAGTASIDISKYASNATAVLFRFTSDGSVTGKGVSISGLSVSGGMGAGVPAPIAGAGLPLLAGLGLAWVRRRRAARAA